MIKELRFRLISLIYAGWFYSGQVMRLLITTAYKNTCIAISIIA